MTTDPTPEAQELADRAVNTLARYKHTDAQAARMLAHTIHEYAQPHIDRADRAETEVGQLQDMERHQASRWYEQEEAMWADRAALRVELVTLRKRIEESAVGMEHSQMGRFIAAHLRALLENGRREDETSAAKAELVTLRKRTEGLRLQAIEDRDAVKCWTDAWQERDDFATDLGALLENGRREDD
jgi:hypothetical protein